MPKSKISIEIGSRFGKLIVLAQAESKGPHAAWLCACDCKAEKTVRADHLRQGRVISCGEGQCHPRFKHGMHQTRTYIAWQSMMQRVNPNSVHQKYYASRDITVCNRWRDFQNFFTDMGECPDGFELDRIDNDGDYEPGNCRWATRQQQVINSRAGSPRTINSDLPRNIERVSNGYRWVYSVWDERGKRARQYGPTFPTIEATQADFAKLERNH